MSAPEDSNRKASPPPSLLSEPGQAAGQNGSRILANLEGRVAPQQAGETAAASRSRKGPLALIALAVIAVAGWGAWRINSHDAAAPTVTAAASAASAAAASAASGATPATLAAASGAAASETSGTQAAQAAGASDAAPQTATIVNDEPASASSGNRLSQALANGATDASSNDATVAAGAAATVAAAKGKPQHQTKAEARLAAAEAKREEAHARQELAAKKRHDRQLEAAAKRRPAGTTAKKPDDPDADLLAALVARTKPADPGVPLSAKPRKEKAAPVQKVAAADTGSLAARVKECSQRGFFEDQLCRWRVCDGHWGKDPSCPSSANQNRQP
ncbi:phage tail protein [Burkholderia gladioli]|uniref:phage tail protein n=1 Tax=Burkholderia gladioli TaxID=28095 RepID=UPI00164219C8|nr:phage tail protein [Burkholderia gladioli]